MVDVGELEILDLLILVGEYLQDRDERLKRLEKILDEKKKANTIPETP